MSRIFATSLAVFLIFPSLGVHADESDRLRCADMLSFEALRIESELERLDKHFGTIVGLKFTAGRFGGDVARARAAEADYDERLEETFHEEAAEWREMPDRLRSQAARLRKDARFATASCESPAELKAESSSHIEAYRSSWQRVMADAGRFAAERAIEVEALAQR